jgi:predicted dehydrogenase
VLRFGLVGTGYWANVAHAAGITAHAQAELVGVWGRDPAKAAALAAKRDVRTFDELDDLIAAVDAVAFSVPPDVQAELALPAAQAGKALLLEKPLALSLEPAERLVEAVRAPTVVFFTFRLDPRLAAWYREQVDDRDWDGASVLYLASIFEPGNPFGHSAWRRERGGLWDLGPHALSALLPALGKVDRVAAVRGPRDQVHLALTHESGAASSVALNLAAPADVNEVAFWNAEGLVRRPEVGEVDVVSAYGAAIDALLAGETPFDARFGLEVVRVLAAAESELAS